MVILLALNLILLKWGTGFESFRLSFFFLIPLGVCFGLVVASSIHNASHGNIHGKIFNRLVGEFCGAWVLYGFSNFIMIHLLHHKHADSDLDPVNPKGIPFLIFLFAPMRFMIRVTINWLRSTHSKQKNFESILLGQTLIFHLNLMLKLIFWFLLFGPGVFLCFYLPSLLTNYGVHAHINHACHREREDGSIEILNLNHNVYYRMVNFFTMGGYFHKNHHTNLRLLNPMHLNT